MHSENPDMLSVKICKASAKLRKALQIFGKAQNQFRLGIR